MTVLNVTNIKIKPERNKSNNAELNITQQI